MENSLEKNIRVYRKATTTERLIRSISNSIAFFIAILVAIFIALGIATFSAMVFIPSIWSMLCCIVYGISVCYTTIWVFYKIFAKKIIYNFIESLDLCKVYGIIFGILFGLFWIIKGSVVDYDIFDMLYDTIIYIVLTFAMSVVITELLEHISKVNS